jgi:REP element-mobilizing transposase RayT
MVNMNNRHRKKYFQPSLDSSIFKETPKYFGGEYLKNSNPKKARPVTTKNAMHVVLRSKLANNTGWSLCVSHDRKQEIENVIREQARLFNIRIYQMAVNSNHLHLLIKLYTRESFSKFIKAISGIIARIALGVKKGKRLGLKFWDSRPFSRIVEWSKGYFKAKEYVIRNDLESCGIIPYAPRGNHTKKYKYKYEKTPIPVLIWERL